MSNAAELLTRLRAIGVQLTLEGDVLRLNAPKGALTPALQQELKASKPELLELLRTMQRNNGQGMAAPMPRVTRQPFMPLSFAQQRLWFLQQMDPESVAYNLFYVIRMQGDLDADILERSLKRIILRHEGLRTCFVQRDGSPYTVIVDSYDWKIDRSALHRREGETLEAAVTRFIQQVALKPFDLAAGPLLRAYLLEVNPRDFAFVFSIHHIVSDGWSAGVLVQELAENYRAFRLNESPRTADLTVQYIDYTVWQRAWLSPDMLERQTKFWRGQLEGAPAVVIFPPDHERLPQGQEQAKRAKLIFPAELTAQLEAFSRAHNVTLFMTMLSAFMLLLSRHSGLKDVVVGSPSANRSRVELNELIGFFVNNLVLRAEVEDGISFLDLLRRIRESTLGAYEHQDVPFDHLVRELQTDRSPDHSPFFQTMFILQNSPIEELKLPGLTVSPLEIDAAAARFDLTAEIYPFRKELHVHFDYRSDLYDEETIAELLQSYRHVLEFVTAHPETPIESVPLCSVESKAQLLQKGNPSFVTMPAGSLLLDALDRFAMETPEKTAVRAGSESLTFAQLNERAENLAHRLKRMGAAPGKLIPVCLHRSTKLLTTLLAVLKTGAAYVPLDPIYPKHRIDGILEDVKPNVLVTESDLLPLLEEYRQHCLVLDANPDTANSDSSDSAEYISLDLPTPDNLAYVIFTSGSTGKPKGVEISHGALSNFLESMRHAPGFTSKDSILAVTTVSFDIAGLELFLPIYAGGEVIIALASGDLPTLLEDLEREKPTVMQATPALWQMLVSGGWQGDPALTALCGGEALTPGLATALLSRVKALWNMYGPTETTIWSSALQVMSADGASVPLGGPIRNTTFYVLDPHQQPVPFGVAGELYIGGDGVARGYFHRPELTAQRFVTPSFGQGERFYRTGDLVRRRRDNTLEFLGRADFQVKLRGFRIELGEIEYAIRQQPEVSECVVLLREDIGGQKELIAYVVPRPGESLTYVRLRQRLRERIPEYMIPAGVVFLDAFPRLPNGKLDRSKLPAPQLEKSSPEEPVDDRIANPTEAVIAKIFRELLHAERIGVDQRFFDLGAHSLLLVKAHDKLRKELDPSLRLVSFFQYPSIAALAAYIDKSRLHEGEIAHAGLR
jgi:amino acid adenylation domain-containing protein